MPLHQMSQELLYDALYAALNLADSILQIWITLTFAVIVSTYVAGKRFDRQVYWLISGLYLLASTVLLTRFASAAYQAFYFKDLLVSRGFEPWPVPNLVSVVIGGGTGMLLLGGTFGTLWFVRHTWLEIESTRIKGE